MPNLQAKDAKIMHEEAKAALQRSGYLIESRIAALLEKDGYYIQANDAYVDPTTAKSRELDLFAMGANKLSRKDDFIFPVVLIECVNNLRVDLGSCLPRPPTDPHVRN